MAHYKVECPVRKANKIRGGAGAAKLAGRNIAHILSPPLQDRMGKSSKSKYICEHNAFPFHNTGIDAELTVLSMIYNLKRFNPMSGEESAILFIAFTFQPLLSQNLL